MFHMLTDIDSTSEKFIFISNSNSKMFEDKYRDLIFEVITTLEICKRSEVLTSST